MPGTVRVNNMSVVHMQSAGVSSAFPDVCKTPSNTGTTPIPYPNIALSTDTASATTQVQCENCGVCVCDSKFQMSSGDEAGVAGGVASSKTKGAAEFVNFSFDVLFENKPVARALDLMLHNGKNTGPYPVVQA